MPARDRRRRGFREAVADDVDLLPLMNLFVALIPMLLVSAVFLNITVIDMKAPGDEAAQARAEQARVELALSVTISAGSYVVEGNGLERVSVGRNDPEAAAQLAKVLAGVAGQYPDNRDVMIVSQSDTRYEDIVRVMDISREAGLPGASLLAAN
ncbi:MAG: biopolymer transporter ExbD [bacterium]|nr:biopolymer transporter ExbD [bacterium]MBK9776549.1 biopolymer transporter ExbD [bacterium]